MDRRSFLSIMMLSTTSEPTCTPEEINQHLRQIEVMKHAPVPARLRAWNVAVYRFAILYCHLRRCRAELVRVAGKPHLTSVRLSAEASSAWKVLGRARRDLKKFREQI